MANSQRRKGLEGEREVAAIFRERHFDPRNLDGRGDLLIPYVGPEEELTLHVEVKRQEVARVWAWLEQAEVEAPRGAIPVVAFRRSHGKWHAIIRLEDLARLLA